ncbi:MAG: putative tRNA/rRNA methyltransferase [Calditrichaeota bacterium]|nr:putative tRNA/rRNA methyltransferase [Calditrichota bacterium]
MRRRRQVARAARPEQPHPSGPRSPSQFWRREERASLADIAVILVEPARPENVGAAARAMKTMGLSRLIVAGADQWRSGKARALAVGSEDILEAAEEYATLAEAVERMRVVAITTARRRRRTRHVHPVESVAPHLIELARDGPVAVVFGREEWGLRTDELLLGDWWMTVPMATAYPSLNLAQSVMLVCHELARAAAGALPEYPWTPAPKGERRRLLEHAARTVVKAGLQPRPDIDGYLMLLGRVLDRALLEQRDVKVLHGVFHQMDVYMHRHGGGEAGDE